LLAASRDGCLPEILTMTNSKGVPVTVLLMQGGIFTLLCSVFLFMPSVSSSFWVLSAVTSILSLLVYVVMFAAALRLRYKYPEVKRAFVIPGGKPGLWIMCLMGLISSVLAAIIGFFPPGQIPIGNVLTYEIILFSGVLLGCLVPWGLYHMNIKLSKTEPVVADF
jgi:glutamate:GABA antiporter